MSLIDRIRNESREALKKGDSKRLETLRFLISLVEKKEFSKEVGQMTETDVLTVLQLEMKRKKESREMFLKAGRDDLSGEIKKEIEILSEYLPKEISMKEIEEVVGKVTKELGQGAVFGVVMGKVMGELKGKADGGKVTEVVKKILGSK